MKVVSPAKQMTADVRTNCILRYIVCCSC